MIGHVQESQPRESKLHPPLSPRELDVLTRLAHGETDKEVAAAIGISFPTVRVYRKRMEAKLGTKGLLPSLLVAWRLGEIDLVRIAQEVHESLESRYRP